MLDVDFLKHFLVLVRENVKTEWQIKFFPKATKNHIFRSKNFKKF
jgi:hypothetical protein